MLNIYKQAYHRAHQKWDAAWSYRKFEDAKRYSKVKNWIHRRLTKNGKVEELTPIMMSLD